MNIKRILLIVSLVAIMAVSVGVIYAQGPGPRGGHRGGERGGHIVDVIAEMTGTEVEAVVEARQNGQSFNDYITANGGDPDEVMSAIIADAQVRLSEAVADGNLDQADADAKLADLEANLAEAMASTEARPVGEGPRGPKGPNAIDIIAEALGLEPQDVFAQLQEGATLAEVIAANDGNVDEIRAELIANATERINTGLEDGRLTQEEADEKLADLETHIDELLNGEFEARMGQRGEAGRGPRGGGRR